MQFRATRAIYSIIKGKSPKMSDISCVCNVCQPIFAKEDTLLQLKSPIHIVGDLHGNINDLLRVFVEKGIPPSERFLFLGDYVNKGPSSVEVISLLLGMKVLFPSDIYLLRGNHETDVMGRMFGFKSECKSKLSLQMYTLINKVFDLLPIAALIEDQVFCVHGGISPKLEKVDQIKDVKRPLKVPDEGLITDLLWSDPTIECDEWKRSPRGSTYLWGKKALFDFLHKNNLKMMIRAHEVVYEGVATPFAGATTVFTSSYYEGKYKNKAGFVTLNEDLEIEPTILVDELPNTKELASHFLPQTKEVSDRT